MFVISYCPQTAIVMPGIRYAAYHGLELRFQFFNPNLLLFTVISIQEALNCVFADGNICN